MMLLQALHTYKLQIPVTFPGKPVPHTVQAHKAYMHPGLQAPEKQLSVLVTDKSICKIMSIFFSSELNAFSRVLKMKSLLGKV